MKKSRTKPPGRSDIAAVQDRTEPARSAAPSPVWKRDWFFGLVLAIVTLFAYSPAWNGKPVWDDDYYLTPPSLQSWSGLARIWMHPGVTPQYYPLTYSLFWVQYHLWGYSPLGYHLLNILLHITSALLLLKILRRLEIPGAPLAAATFALHPVQVESVAWMAELKNTLSGVLFLGAGFTYLHFALRPRWLTYALALGLFALGILAKSVIAVLPAALLVVLWWKDRKLSLKKDVLPLVPFFAIGAGFGLLSAWMERRFVGAVGPDYAYSAVERCLIAGRAIWFYLSKLAWPQTLIFMYPRWQISQAIWWQYLFPAFALGVLLALWLRRRQSRGPVAAFLLFVGILFPALGFVNVYPFKYSFVADHFQYLASIGPITLVSAGIALLNSRLKKPLAQFLKPLAGALLAVLAATTWLQAGTYSDVETLWQTTIDRNPDCWMAHSNLGLTLLQKGQPDAALAQLLTVVKIKPDHADSYNNIGSIFQDRGEWETAISYYKQAVALSPDNASIYFNLGVALRNYGDTEGATANLKKVVELKPGDAEAHRELGLALQQKDRTSEAIEQYQAAIAIEPNVADSFNDLGSALLASRQPDDAIRQYRHALTLQQDNADALNNLAWVLSTASPHSLRNGTEAVELARRATLLTNGKNVTVLNTLTAAYAEANRFDEALTVARNVLQFAQSQSNSKLMNMLQREMAFYQSHRALP